MENDINATLFIIGLILIYVVPRLTGGNRRGGNTCTSPFRKGSRHREIIMANQEGLQVYVTLYNMDTKLKDSMVVVGELHGFTGNTVTVKDGNQYITYDTERNMINVRPV